VTSIAGGTKAEVKFELLADLDDQPAGAEVVFDGCERLGAANLRGTGYAARDVVLHDLSAEDDGVMRNVQVAMSGIAGFLLAKLAAAAGRRKPKDWYDIAFVLLHNDAGGVAMAAELVNEKFPAAAAGEARTWLVDLQANFADSSTQGVDAYVEQMLLDHPDEDSAQLAGDAARDFRVLPVATTEQIAGGFTSAVSERPCRVVGGPPCGEEGSGADRSTEHAPAGRGGLPAIPFDHRAARACGRVAAELRASGRKMTACAYDALISATAVANELPVFTLNVDDFSGITSLTVVEVDPV